MRCATTTCVRLACQGRQWIGVGITDVAVLLRPGPRPSPSTSSKTKTVAAAEQLRIDAGVGLAARFSDPAPAAATLARTSFHVAGRIDAPFQPKVGKIVAKSVQPGVERVFNRGNFLSLGDPRRSPEPFLRIVPRQRSGPPRTLAPVPSRRGWRATRLSGRPSCRVPRVITGLGDAPAGRRGRRTVCGGESR